MKYQQLLDTNMVPEWRNQYLDYNGLDAALNRAIENKNIKARREGVEQYSELIKFNQKFACLFSRECQAQLDKINAFHGEKLNEMRGKFNNLQDQLEQVLSCAIYREIQPKIVQASHNRRVAAVSREHQHRDSTLSSYATVSSVSELFKNLKSRVASSPTPPSTPPQTCDSRTSALNETLDSTGRGAAIKSHPSIKDLFLLREASSTNNHAADGAARQSLSPFMSFGESSEGRSRRDSSMNLRASRERVALLARKLSGNFSISAQRVASNLRSGGQGGGIKSCYNSSGNNKKQAAHQRHESDYLTANSKFNSFDAQILSRTTDADGGGGGGGGPEVDLQVLSGATPQSRQKIVACYKKKLSNLKFAFGELYFNLVLFEQYTQLNHNGFQQILRKHDRMFASSIGRKFYEEHVQTADFYINLQEIDHLLENVEHIYTLHFENGNRRKAIEKLQVPANVYKPSSAKLDFRVGYEFGIFTVLLMLVILIGLVSETRYDWRTVFRLYRSPLTLIIFMFQTGISIVIWKHYKINHVLIFELNPRNNLSFHHFIEFGSVLGIIWSISVLLFLFSEKFNLKPSICPLMVVLVIVIYLFNPTQTCHYQARFWLLRILGRIFVAPFSGRVRFADFWIADQLVSIVPLFLDLEFLFCFYTTGEVLSVDHLTPYYANRCVTMKPQDLVIRTIVAALPAWFRCVQCLRRWRDENWLRLHLANAGKYWCMVMVVVLSSVSQYNKHSFELDMTRIIWMVAAIFTSSLTAYWDIIYDFGLFNKYDKTDDEGQKTNNNTRRNTDGSIASCFESDEIYRNCKLKNKTRRKRYPFLRKELVYPVWVYYFAIVENIILRFGWIITISLTEFSNIEAGLVVSLLAPMEMFRRFVWNCIRLENEQLNNCGLFRAVRDIPMEVVAPIDESHLDKVIMMMDSRDGPSMRSRLMKRRTLHPDRASFMVLRKPVSSDGL